MEARHQDPEWAALWPAAERRVRRALVRRHVPRELAAELLQETAVRLVATNVRIRTVDELASWAYTVASRLAIDNARRRRLPTVPLSDADVLVEEDPASIIEARLALETTMAAVHRLPATDRAALLSVFEKAPATRVEAVRWAVRRHRARVRLAAMLGQAGVVVAWVAGGWRRLLRARSAAVPAALVPVLLVVLVLPVVLPAPDGGSATAGAMPQAATARAGVVTPEPAPPPMPAPAPASGPARAATAQARGDVPRRSEGKRFDVLPVDPPVTTPTKPTTRTANDPDDPFRRLALDTGLLHREPVASLRDGLPKPVGTS